MNDEEGFSQYCPGGWHAVHLGDFYKDGRYKIVYKLGAGAFTTVWLVRDEQIGYGPHWLDSATSQSNLGLTNDISIGTWFSNFR